MCSLTADATQGVYSIITSAESPLSEAPVPHENAPITEMICSGAHKNSTAASNTSPSTAEGSQLPAPTITCSNDTGPQECKVPKSKTMESKKELEEKRKARGRAKPPVSPRPKNLTLKK